MEAKLVENSSDWEAFVSSARPNSFLQSWAWGEMQEALNRKIFRIGVYENNKLTAAAFFFLYKTRFGSFLYCPHGPILRNSNNLAEIVAKAVEIGRQEKCLFLRIDPLFNSSKAGLEIFKDLKFSTAPTYIQPEVDWVLDISPSIEELTKQMRETTRRYLRKEEREGITVNSSTTKADAKVFADLLEATASRKGFSGHGRFYYEKAVEILSKYDQIRLYKAVQDGKTQAMAMIVFYAGTAYYIHGASASHESKSVSYSFHLQAIRDAKERGFGFYNFGGVVREENFYPGHPWYGISFFKMGFGGARQEYLKAQDLPLSSNYSLYRFAEQSRETIRKIFKGGSIY